MFFFTLNAYTNTHGVQHKYIHTYNTNIWKLSCAQKHSPNVYKKSHFLNANRCNIYETYLVASEGERGLEENKMSFLQSIFMGTTNATRNYAFGLHECDFTHAKIKLSLWTNIWIVFIFDELIKPRQPLCLSLQFDMSIRQIINNTFILNICV